MLLAPNGKKSNLTNSQYKLVRTPAFKKWFGDWENNPSEASKVVDENGEPLVVYNRNKKKFNIFDTDKQLNGWLGKGFYFSESKSEFKDYGKIIISTFLNIKNPFAIKGESPSDFLYELKLKFGVNEFDSTKILKENKCDGVIYKHWDYESKMFSCFEPNQIKLADGTNTTFDSNNNDIRFDDGGRIINYGCIINKNDLVFEYREKDNGDWFDIILKTPYLNPIGVIEVGKISKDNWKILNVGIKDNCQGLGYGKLLYEKVFDKLSKSKGQIIYSDTTINSPFVHKIWEKYSAEKLNIGIDWNGENKFQYKLKLDDINNNDIRFDNGGQVQDLISQGVVELKIFDTKPEHAKEYGLDSVNPLYVQSLCITENQRLKGIGNKVLQYIDDYAIKNGHDLVFGHITQKAEFTKDNRETFFCDTDMIKNWLHSKGYTIQTHNNDFHKVINNDIRYKKGGMTNKGFVSYKDKYNTKYGYSKGESHDLEEISKDAGVSMKGLQQIYNKGIGAYKTNPSSVRPNVKSKEQWAMARVYSSVMGGKASKIDSNELKMERGGILQDKNSIRKYAENLLKDFDYKYTGYSESNYGNSMYFDVDGIKCRFSDHTLTNRDRMINEINFSINDVNSESTKFSNNQSLLQLKYRLGDKSISYSKIPYLMRSGRYLDAFGYTDLKDSKMEQGGKLNRGGDCYFIAGQFVLNNDFINKIDFIGTPYLVHAEVQGQGAISHLRYGHAFIEDNVFVYDYSNNREIQLPKDYYYKIADIKTNNPKKYRKYTFKQAKEKMYETNKYGCWDLEVDYAKGGNVNFKNNNMYYPKQSLGLKRNQMPQIRKQFLPILFKKLSRDRIKYKDSIVSANTLKPSQNEINIDLTKTLNEEALNRKTIIVSSDNYIIDGHHRWYYAFGNNIPVMITKIDLPIEVALNYISQLDFIEQDEIAKRGMLINSQRSLFDNGGNVNIKGKIKGKVIHKEYGIEYYDNGNLIHPTQENKQKWLIFGFPNNIEKKEQSFETIIDEIYGNTQKEISNKFDNNLINRKYSYLGFNPNLSLIYDKSKFGEGGNIEVEKYHKEIPIDIYEGIIGDFDDDGISNADDLKPNRKSKTKLEEVSLKQEITEIVNYRNLLVDVQKKVLTKIKKINTCGKIQCEIKTRIKTPYSIINKLRRRSLTDVKTLDKLDKKAEEFIKNKNLKGIDLYKGLTDILGFMVIVEDFNLLNKLKLEVESGKLGEVLEFEDLYKKNVNGYTAYHFLLSTEINGVFIPYELQLRTIRVNELAKITHTIYKQGTMNSKINDKISKEIELADKGNKAIAKIIDKKLENKELLKKQLTIKKLAFGDIIASGFLSSYKYKVRNNANKLINSITEYGDNEAEARKDLYRKYKNFTLLAISVNDGDFVPINQYVENKKDRSQINLFDTQQRFEYAREMKKGGKI